MSSEKALKSPGYVNQESQVHYEKVVCQYANWFCHWIESSKMPVPESMLDVGCRSGASTLNFMQALPSTRVVGIDVEPEFIMEARERGAMVLEQDVQTVDEMGQRFDYVFASQVLEHVEDPAKAIRALHQCVELAMFVGVPMESEGSFRDNESHHVRFDEWGWLELFKEDWRPRNLWYDIRTNYLNFVVVKKGVM
jgi:SAM-dependent methyltransferase